MTFLFRRADALAHNGFWKEILGTTGGYCRWGTEKGGRIPYSPPR
jgi:hypothetical protein